MKRIVLICLAASLMVGSANAQNRGGWGSSWSSSQARDAVKTGNMSLSAIYAKLRRQYGGNALDARLVNGDTYQIKWETSDGRVLNLRVDAKSGQIK